MANPITKVYLLDVPLENDYKNTLYFANASAQQTYFQSRIIASYSYNDFSYQRKDQIIRVPVHYDSIYICNYVMYQNSAYNNKWFYAFVNDLEYINDGRTDLHIETDVIQTWMFDYTVKSSFVEREHVNNDTIGLHTVPEGLETGDYVNQPGTELINQIRDLNYLANPYIVVALTEIPDFAMPVAENGRVYNGIYSGLYYLVFRSAVELDKFITGLQSVITEDVIYSIFMIPRNIVTLGESEWDDYTVGGIECEFAFYPFTERETTIGEIGINKETYLDDDYVPRNNKLLTYPYRYLLISNNSGSVNEYKYELFDESYCPFIIKGAVSPGCAIKLYPQNYKPGMRIEGIDGGKLPTCSWTNDAYTNWLTQNAVNIKLDRIKNVGAIIGGTALAIGSGGTAAMMGGGLALSGIMGIGESMKTIYEHSLAPETAKGGVNQGDLNFAEGNTFSVYKMSIRSEWASRIDKYFDMFGYKVNMVKVPNSNHRSRYWYTKTIGVNINGDIPQIDMQKIKNCYDNGITFWRSASDIENYADANPIV